MPNSIIVFNNKNISWFAGALWQVLNQKDTSKNS